MSLPPDLITYRIPQSHFSSCTVYKQKFDCLNPSPCFVMKGVMAIFSKRDDKFCGITVAHLFTDQSETYCLVNREGTPIVFFEYRCNKKEMEQDLTCIQIGEIDAKTQEVIVKTNKIFPEKIHLHRN